MDLEERIGNLKIHNTKETIPEDLIREIIRSIIFSHRVVLGCDGIIYGIIEHTKCDYSTALKIETRMSELGLNTCTMIDGTYLMPKFAKLRGYMTDGEIDKVWEEIGLKEKKQEDITKYFTEKYGNSSKWSDDIWDEYFASGGV